MTARPTGEPTDLFLDLTPERVLEAVEAGGTSVRPVCYPLNSFENRVYEVELADLVAYIYFLPFADPAGDASRGATIFRDRACAGCHGGGASARSEAPDLSTSEAMRSPAEMVAAMWNHAPLMREAILGEGLPWPELTGRDLRDLRAYLESAASAKGEGR